MSASAPPGVALRPFDGADLDEVVGLLERALGPASGGVDRRALFEWKHLANPIGPSLALVAEADGRIVGLRAFMRWRFRSPAGPVEAVRAVDTATDPAAQRRGVFTALTRAALALCEDEGVGLVFNTPNAKSLPGYLKLGWTAVARWPMWLKARRPDRLLGAAARRDLVPGPPVEPPPGSPLRRAGEVLAGLDESLTAGAGSERHLWTDRTLSYLTWRYASGPLPYHALTAGEPPAVVAVVRLRRRGRLREAVVCELLATPDASRAAKEVLGAIPRAAGADHAVAHFGPGWAARSVLARAGYRRLPRAGMAFTVRPVRAPGGVASLEREAWSLSLGDLEVF